MSHPPKVTLEDLLRLKRAERPTPEFWTQFERELRQKQLTALVQKRRWWDDLPFRLGRRFYIPAGATAVIAVTLLTVRYSTPAPVVQIEGRAEQIASVDPVVVTLPTTIVEQSSALVHAKHEERAAMPTAVDHRLRETANPRAENLAPEMSPSARSIATNLARLERDEPELVNAVMGNRLSSPVRAQTTAITPVEITPASTGGVSRQYRLIARYADRTLSPEPAAPAPMRERLARRLGDDLGDNVSRIGVVGDRVSLKF